MNTSTLITAAVAALTAGLKGFATADDNAAYQDFATQIITDGVAAQAAGDTDLIQQLKDESGVLLELHRIKVAAGADATASAVVAAVLQFAVTTAI